MSFEVDAASEADELYHPAFPLSRVILDSENPRKPQLEACGLSEAVVSNLAMMPGESINEWYDRYHETFPGHTEEAVAFWQEIFGLAQSIHQVGLLEPLVMDANKVLIAGERRYWASRLLGRESAPIVEKRSLADKNRLLCSIIENSQRANLSVACLIPAYLGVLEQLFMVDAWTADTRKRVLKLQVIQNTLSMNKTEANKVLHILRAWSHRNHPLHEAVQRGDISSIHGAYRFCLDQKDGTNKNEKSKVFNVRLPTLQTKEGVSVLLDYFGKNPRFRPLVCAVQSKTDENDFASAAEIAFKQILSVLAEEADQAPHDEPDADGDRQEEYARILDNDA